MDAPRHRGPNPRPWVRVLPWALPLGVTLAGTAVMGFLILRKPPPPVLRQLAPFELVTSGGRPFGSKELRGHRWVAGFFFTRCRSICPRLMDDMAALRQELDRAGLGRVVLVSISVDPDHDTPTVLEEYSARFGPRRSWEFLGGRAEQIERLVSGGFALETGRPRETGPGLIDIAHTGRLVLVDGDLRVRGYHEHDAAGRRDLIRDLREL